jgi:D-serine deaminase-like pyridoxal phosphate-dependent protein
MGWTIFAIVLGLLSILLFLVKPRDRGGGYDAYFAGLNQALKNARVGAGRILIDLDRLEHNLGVLRAHIPSASHYRIVVKSIPCVDLLRTIRERIGTDKFMVVHRPFLKVILESFPAGIDILLGKALPLFALAEFFQEIPASLRERAQVEIQWLVDTPELLRAYQEYAVQNRLRLRISLEIDIGLHRGGIADNETLDRMLALLEANPDRLVFSGFMGYEGHVAHAPALFTSSRQAALAEFADNMAAYQRFIDHIREKYPALFTGELTFNSGGSGTYSLFTDYPFITDIGIGGAVLRPASYPAHFLHDLLPAEFIAAPVIKKSAGCLIPFVESLAGLLEWWDPNNRVSVGIYGGGWAGRLVGPQGIRPQILTNDPANQNLVPNQSTLSGSTSMQVEIGDYVFYHPYQSDAMFQFEDILLMRGSMVAGCWPVFDRRY